MLKVVEAKPLADYKLYLRYADGTEGTVDLSHLVGKGVFAAWNDPTKFADATIGEGGEIRWGDKVDLCPDALYMEMTGKSPDEIFPALKSTIHA